VIGPIKIGSPLPADRIAIYYGPPGL